MKLQRITDDSRFRYLVGGVLATLLNNVILIAGDRLGIGYVVLSVLCFAITGTLSYGYHSRVTFRRALDVRSYAMFMTGLLLGLGLTVIALYLLHDLMDLAMWIAAPLTTVLLTAYLFISAKFATTRQL